MSEQRIQNVDVGRIKVESIYQREERSSFIRRQVFSWERYTPIAVSSRGDGYYYVIDGQQRVALARKAGIRTLSAVVHSGLTLKDEARIYEEINTIANRMSALEHYKARNIYDPLYQEIDAVVRNAGFHVGNNDAASHCITAADALYKIYTRYGGAYALRRVLAVISQAWAGSAESLTGVYLLGLAAVLHQQEEKGMSVEVMAKKLSRWPEMQYRQWAKICMLENPRISTPIAYAAAFRRGLFWRKQKTNKQRGDE